ncbi:CAAX prenyl protease 2 [Momordica charantia]|uniref:intramembrane prenyl-peptidase Rce1 n=1 Tax=Momordica charantia TaxID=3673 RepID=A0A6J1CU25_MOMCH|nr:CAAX prenyl protease 2 [Momordica charantia]
MEEEDCSISKAVAVTSCTAMTLFYVAVLYAPTSILRLPPPPSLQVFMIRRFICAFVSTVVSVVVCALILPIRKMEFSLLLGAYGIRADHIWQVVVFPLSLTSLMYAGSMILKSLLLVDSWREYMNHGEGSLVDCASFFWRNFLDWGLSTVSNVLAWRNYVVAPLTEELVFRACMIPVLLSGGFKPTTVIFLCPILFSLAHLNHFMEYYSKQNNNLVRAITVVGLQLGYTVVFGSYATFLFARSGHLLAPLVAHVFCNFMGLPVLFSRRRGVVCLAFVVGMVGFLWLLFPMTSPNLFNERTNNCRCWHGYCTWN